jgi:hypothetical protein
MTQAERDKRALDIAHEIMARGATFYPEEFIEFARRLREEVEQQLAEREKQMVEMRNNLRIELFDCEKQNVLLRYYIQGIQAVAESSIKTHGYDKQHMQNISACKEALDATADLSGLILCDAEPVADVKKHTGEFKDMAIIVWRGEQPAEGTPLYKAKEKP